LADFAFRGTESITSGKTTIAVQNNGPQVHEAGIVKLENGVTVDQVRNMVASAAPPPPGPSPITESGGIVALAPGGQGWFDIDLPAGNYAFICFVPDISTGQPHAALGMIQGFSIK